MSELAANGVAVVGRAQEALARVTGPIEDEGGQAMWVAAKAGVIAFTRHIAGEFASRGIRANCVAPPAIENARMRTWMTDGQRDHLGRSFPLGRLGQPADVGAATLFLASDASSWITGATLDIADGRIML